MMYVIADKALSNQVGFSIGTHRTNGNLIVLNEKEIMNNSVLKGTLEERCKTINGSLYTNAQISSHLKEGGWND